VAQGAISAEKQAPSGAEYLLSGHWVSMRGIGDIMKEISDASNSRLCLPNAGGAFRRALCGNLQPIIPKKRPIFTSVL